MWDQHRRSFRGRRCMVGRMNEQRMNEENKTDMGGKERAGGFSATGCR